MGEPSLCWKMWTSVFRLTFYAGLAEAQRLAHVIGQGPYAGQPVYDFIQSLLEAFQTTATRVVLDEVKSDLIGSFIYFRRAELDVVLPCYIPDALALALRANLRIYARPQRLPMPSHCHPSRAPPMDVAR